MQVAELETLFEGLRSDVDALFMQTPSVDQEGLCRQCEEMHSHLEEQARCWLCRQIWEPMLDVVCGLWMMHSALIVSADVRSSLLVTYKQKRCATQHFGHTCQL